MKNFISKFIPIFLIFSLGFNYIFAGNNKEIVNYHFRNDELLVEHYNNHGSEMGFDSKEEYEKAANKVVNNQESLHKKEKEDGDDVYYLEETNEFVIVSKDGYIRTYFNPDNGKAYYDKK